MTFFITGIGSGIGRATCVHVLSSGQDVYGTIRKEEQIKSLQQEVKNLPGKLHIINVDLTHQNAVLYIGEELQRLKCASLDVVINVAGVLSTQEIGGITLTEIERVMHLNFTFPVLLTQQLLPLLINGVDSNIINITSMSGYPGSVRFPGLSIYGASKAALGSFTESLAAEIWEQGVRINALAIGAVNTQMLKSAFPDYTAQVSPSEMGRYIYSFATEGNRLMNGKVLAVALTNP